MTDISSLLASAVAAHQAGDLGTAKATYEQILQADADQPDALHFMGLLNFQRGDMAEAERLIRRSVEVFPANAGAHNNLGNLMNAMKRRTEALEAYQTAIGIDPGHADTWNNVGVLLRSAERMEEAANVLEQATRLAPDHAEAWHNLALTYLFWGQLERAAETFEHCIGLGEKRWSDPVWHARVLCELGRREPAIAHLEAHLERNPDNPVVRHQLAALKGEDVPRASDDYVRDHFDHFSDSFDEILKQLDYRAPEIVAATVEHLQQGKPQLADVIDLGCGTGLCGPLIRHHCGKLTGLDLSPGMLRKANELNCYDYLVEGELVACLLDAPKDCFDLAVCVDTLCYFGALDEMFSALHPALKPGGSLVATVEHLQEEIEAGYRIDQSGRYSHREPYIRGAVEGSGLRLVSIEPVVLRRELGRDVHGFVFVAARPGEL